MAKQKPPSFPGQFLQTLAICWHFKNSKPQVGEAHEKNSTESLQHSKGWSNVMCASTLCCPCWCTRTWFRRGWEPTTFRAKSQPSNWNSMNHEEFPIAHLCKHEKHWQPCFYVEIWASKNGWMLDAPKNDQIMAVWLRLGWRMFQPQQKLTLILLVQGIFLPQYVLAQHPMGPSKNTAGNHNSFVALHGSVFTCSSFHL